MALLTLGLGWGCGSEKADVGDIVDPVGGADGGGDNGATNQGNNNADLDSGPGNTGSDASAGNNDPDPMDAGKDSGSPDVPCIPMYSGCDDKYPNVDPGVLCGEIDNGCGVMIDCDPEDDNCSGFDIACNDPSKPNQCGCKTNDCSTAITGGAECGTNVPNGCGGTIPDCGNCSGKTGANWGCGSTSFACECTPLSQSEACGAKACGSATDECGTATYGCGALDGACPPARTCGLAGACDCRDASYAPTACAGKTCGSVTVDGCQYSCGDPCIILCGAGEDCTNSCSCAGGQQCNTTSQRCCTPSSEAALCAGQACGTVVTDACSGAQYTCGCPDGQGCVDKAFIEGVSANQCVESNLAKLLGGYLVRTHAFSDGTGAGFTKAESVSVVKISRKADSSVEIIDTGCVATAFAYGSSTTQGTQSVTPAYFQVPGVVRPITQPTSTTWSRPFKATPVGLGLTFGLPSFCDGTNPTPMAAPDFDAIDSDVDGTPTPWSGSQKDWLGDPSGACTCPTSGAVCTDNPANRNCFPAPNGASPTGATDCRIHDIDEDGLPGLTAIASNGAVIGAITAANIEWQGTLSDVGHHAGHQSEPNPLLRQIVSCTGNGLCGFVPNISSTTCDGANLPKYNRVQFRKLSAADFESMSCSVFYNRPLASVATSTGWTGANPAQGAVKQSAIDGYFQGMFECSQGSCPDGMKCNADNLCWPITSPGACSGTSDTSCGPNWACGYGDGTKFACWPQRPTGSLCNN